MINILLYAVLSSPLQLKWRGVIIADRESNKPEAMSFLEPIIRTLFLRTSN